MHKSARESLRGVRVRSLSQTYMVMNFLFHGASPRIGVLRTYFGNLSLGLEVPT